MPPRRNVFNVDACAIPSVWCGSGNIPMNVRDNIRYTRNGERHECMKKGFGAGLATERTRNVNMLSLQKIKYIGEVYEAAFGLEGIDDQDDLIARVRRSTPRQIEILLTRVLTRRGGGLDTRAYNSVLYWLYTHLERNLPPCRNI